MFENILHPNKGFILLEILKKLISERSQTRYFKITSNF